MGAIDREIFHVTRYLSVSIVTLAALAVWLAFGESTMLTNLGPQATNANPDAVLRQSYLKDAVLWRYDESGQRDQTLSLAAAEQFTSSDTQHLQELRFEGLDSKGDLWIMTSKAGELRANGSELFLSGDVRIRDNRTNSTLDTTDLMIFLDQKIARNEAPLTLTSTTSKTHAEGLIVDFEKGTATLKRKVETVYEP